MVVSGKYLPAVSSYPASGGQQDRLHQQQSSLERFGDSDFRQQQRQQTVEYVFRGEFDEELYPQDRIRTESAQLIDPANLDAISSYNDHRTVSPDRPQRQGRWVDIFI